MIGCGTLTVTFCPCVHVNVLAARGVDGGGRFGAGIGQKIIHTIEGVGSCGRRAAGGRLTSEAVAGVPGPRTAEAVAAGEGIGEDHPPTRRRGTALSRPSAA